MSNNEFAANELIKYKADVNKPSSSSKYPLEFAKNKDSKKIYRILKNNGANEHVANNSAAKQKYIAKSYSNNTTKHFLIDAAARGDLEKVQLILKSKDSANIINLQDTQGETALTRAIFNSHEDIVKLLLESNANCNPASISNFSPFQYAVKSNNPKIVTQLFEKCTNIDPSSGQINAALITSVKNKPSTEIIKILLSHNANPNTTDKSTKSALIYSTINNCVTCVNLLIQSGSNAHYKDNNNRNALWYAAKTSNVDLLNIFLRINNSDLGKDNSNVSPLMRAAEYGNLNGVKMLLKYTNNINQQDHQGNSALMIASTNGYNRIIRLLNQNDADIDLRNNIGNTALLLAIKSKRLETAKLLVNLGADVSIWNDAKEKPLDIANTLSPELSELIQDSSGSLIDKIKSKI